MQWKDYLKIQILKPTLDESENEKEFRKIKFNESFEENNSKLESIEMLYNNSKFQDSKILIQVLNEDIKNPILQLHEKEKSQIKPNEAFQLIQDKSISEICIKEYSTIQEILKIVKFDSKEVEDSISSFQKIFDSMQKYFKKEKIGSLHTSLDDYKKRIFVQSSVLIFLLLLFGITPIKNKIKYPNVQNGKVEFFYTTQPDENFHTGNLLTLDLVPQGWHTYSFKFTPSKNLYKLRIDPLTQSKIKIQIKEIRILDNKGKILKERDLLIGNDLRIKNYQEIESIHQFKTGKMIPGKYVEVISDGNDPHISFNFGVLHSVGEVQITYRVAKGNFKFTD
ncbi:MAG: hypothetical protein L6Q54_11810 [Leptospiraceae bacterium]|nr:hypothetical protein [Leptospiraceae bacterium]MCK6381915.1 hypothetical protein [Leptospiraceae bacterium]